MGFEDVDTTAEGTPGMERVLEPEWVGTKRRERGPCGLWRVRDGAAGISSRHVCFPIYFIRNQPHYGPEHKLHKRWD